MKCSACGKNEAVTENDRRYFKMLDFSLEKGKRYYRQIYFCEECQKKFEEWLSSEGYEQNGEPKIRVTKNGPSMMKLMENKITDLEAQVKSLSDTLAEKDHKIMDLEAEKERLIRTWGAELCRNGKIRKELSEYKTKCAKQEAAIRCKDMAIIELANKREKHA